MTAEFWDKRAQEYDKKVQQHDAAYRQTIASTRALLSDSDVVLDFGCGSGEFGVDIASSVQRVHGIDTSPRMIALASDKARSREVDNIIFNHADLYDVSLAENSYTGVLAFSILHLVDDLHAVLSRIVDLLPTGGLLVSETPCLAERGRLFKLFIAFAQKLKVAPAILNLTAGDLEAEIVRVGFDITESKEWDPKNAIRWIVAKKRQPSH